MIWIWTLRSINNSAQQYNLIELILNVFNGIISMENGKLKKT